jgi:DNA-cytosine methyltransferase
MKYLSLFSGIGGFEVAIHRIFPNATCIGYSEIKPHAIKVYKHHFPKHKNLGDITKITEEQLMNIECDLLVAGFPCTNLSSMASIQGDNSGLNGKQSGLFYDMIRIIKIVRPTYIIIENNYSMNKSNRCVITETLQKLFDTKINLDIFNSADFGLQSRKRLFWTNFDIQNLDRICTQTWDNVLEPIEKVQDYFITHKMVHCLNHLVKYNKKFNTRIAYKFNNENAYKFKYIDTLNEVSRWQLTPKSDTAKDKAQTFLGSGGGSNNILIDRRHYMDDVFYARRFVPVEVERLFHYEEGYTDIKLSKTSRYNLLGNSVVIRVVEYILKSLKEHKKTLTKSVPKNGTKPDTNYKIQNLI